MAYATESSRTMRRLDEDAGNISAFNADVIELTDALEQRDLPESPAITINFVSKLGPRQELDWIGFAS